MPKCEKNKNGWLDQNGAEPFEWPQFGTAGTEWVNEIASQGQKLGSKVTRI